MLSGVLANLRDQGADLWRMHSISHRLTEYNLPLLVRLSREYLAGRRAASAHMSQEEASCIRASFEALGPVFIKMGQLLSTRSDLLPATLCEELGLLQSRASAVPTEAVVGELDRALPDWRSRIEVLYEAPVATGSVAQCHAAVVDGEAVLLKVRRPNIVPQIECDMRIFLFVAEILSNAFEGLQALGLASAAQETLEAFEREMDFRTEAATMEHFRVALEQHVLVPHVNLELTCESVLVMEFMDGAPFMEAAAQLSRSQLQDVLGHVTQAYARMLLLDPCLRFHADIHPGNLLLTKAGRVVLLDFGLTGALTQAQRDALLQLCFHVGLGHGREAACVFAGLCMGPAGTRVSDAQKEQVARASVLVFDDFARRQLAGADAARQTLDLLSAVRALGCSLPSGFCMLFKSLSTLEGIGRTLDPGFDVVQAVRPVVLEALLHLANPRFLLDRCAALLCRFTEGLQSYGTQRTPALLDAARPADGPLPSAAPPSSWSALCERALVLGLALLGTMSLALRLASCFAQVPESWLASPAP